MTPGSSLRPEWSPRNNASGGWTTSWTDGPPSDWDEIRDRLRSLHPPKGTAGRARRAAAHELTAKAALALAAPPPIESLGGPSPARVSWRRADQIVPTPLLSLAEWLDQLTLVRQLRHWWYVHDPLLVQRLALVTSLLLVALVVLALR